MSKQHQKQTRCGSSRWWLALPVAVAGACATGSTDDPMLREGQQAYDQYCALCHGYQGEGYRSDAANALANPTFLASATDELLWTGTARGRPGTPMSPWGQDRGGPLTDAQVDAIVAWIRHWQTEPTVDVHRESVEGELLRAPALYDGYCASCHGEVGEGKPYMSLHNPEFLLAASDGFLRYGTAEGRPGTPMPAFKDQLTTQGIADLVALIRSWQQPVDDTPYEPPSHDLGEVVVNQGGPEPPFADHERAGRFIGVDHVKQAIDDGMQLALLDARPPSDYVHSHITGAVSVPFYLAETYLDQLDPSWTFVSYCGCPHSISGQLLDLLKEQGYPKVWVLDEGFFVWEDRGYPVTTGPTPN